MRNFNVLYLTCSPAHFEEARDIFIILSNQSRHNKTAEKQSWISL